MSRRQTDPLLLDVVEVAEHAQQLEGSRALRSFGRLAEMAHPEAQPAAGDAVDWRVRGERRAKRGEAPQIWLHLEARSRSALVCQRCLQPLALALEAQRSFRFVDGEETAARLDAETEDDVLATSRSLDILGLVEDELLLALPLVPRHADCRMPLAQASFAADMKPGVAGDVEANPFAILAALERPAGEVN